MGIRVTCPNGHALNLKSHLAGKRGICPKCGARFEIPVSGTEEPPGQGPEVVSEVVRTVPPSAELRATVADDEPSPGSPPAGVPTAGSAPPAKRSSWYWELPNSGTPAAQPAAALGQAAFAARGGDEPWFLKIPSGEQFGPASTETLHGWLADGRVPVDGQIWRPSWPAWRLASEVFGRPAPDTLPAMSAAGNTLADNSGERPQVIHVEPHRTASSATSQLWSDSLRRRRQQSLLILSGLTATALLLLVVLLVILLR